MARSFLVLALSALIPATCVFAEPPPPPPPTPDATPGGPPWEQRREKKDRGPRDDRDSDRRSPDKDGDRDGDGPFGRFKKRLEQMSPEERAHFQDNWKRWKQMGSGEKKDWQDRAAEDRDRIKKVIDDTIQKLGLKLDNDQREVFVVRYRQERRKIEEQLCQEMATKRESEVNAMLQRLKSEFSISKVSAPTPALAGSGKP